MTPWGTSTPFERPEPLHYIAIGEQVRWKSQGGGVEKEKRGTILAFVPAGASARFLAPDAYRHGAAPRRRFDHSVTSLVDRYVVEVPRTGKKGQPLPSHFYAPYASVVENWNPDARAEGEEDET